MKSKIKWLIALIILVLLAGLYSVVDKKLRYMIQRLITVSIFLWI